MVRFALILILFFLSPAYAQDQKEIVDKLFPPGVSKVGFLGDTLATIAFCNLWKLVDQYELAAGMRFFGITSVDQKAMEAVQQQQYDKYRREITTISQHRDFCSAAARHPFMTRIMRQGVPIIAGSDHRRQPEKIEFFGKMLGPVFFCNIPFDGEKWGTFLFEMGVTSVSMAALNKRADAATNELKIENASKTDIAAYCLQVRKNPAVARFIKR
jgi:hypothetical protein